MQTLNSIILISGTALCIAAYAVAGADDFPIGVVRITPT